MAPKQATRSTPVTTTPTPIATTTTSVTNAQLQAMIDQGCQCPTVVQHVINRNGDDSHTSGTGGRRTERIVQECTYQDFMKCKPLYFKGTEGVVELTQWFERMETVFHISNCPMENQVKFSTCTLQQAENKRKFENTSRNNQNQQQHNKRQNTGRAYTAGTGGKEPYGGSKPLCAKCNYHHDGQKPTCFECGVQGHYKRECPKLKNNKNRGNQGGNDRAPAKVYVVGRAGTNPDSNVVTGNQYTVRLHIISYSKTQEYMLKGCPVFLAHVTTNKVEDKSEKKRLKDVPNSRNIPEVIHEDFRRSSSDSIRWNSNRFWYLCLHPVLGTLSIGPSEKKELSEQLKRKYLDKKL
ncbi:reverse transcriptase domain-containing protein [Tanacetum coccineum]